MTDILSRLAELAEQATPGEWERGIGNDSRFVNVRSGPRIAEVYGPWDGFFVAAACNFARTELPALVAENKRLREALAFHPRAAKLMQKGKPFIVVAVDEPYFEQAYDMIRFNEKLHGTWTDEDESLFTELCRASQTAQKE